MSEAKKVKKVNITRRDFDIREIYTPLSVAKKEIWKRWNDKELRKKVEDFLGGDVPEVLKSNTLSTKFCFFDKIVRSFKVNKVHYQERRVVL